MPLLQFNADWKSCHGPNLRAEVLAELTKNDSFWVYMAALSVNRGQTDSLLLRLHNIVKTLEL